MEENTKKSKFSEKGKKALEAQKTAKDDFKAAAQKLSAANDQLKDARQQVENINDEIKQLNQELQAATKEETKAIKQVENIQKHLNDVKKPEKEAQTDTAEKDEECSASAQDNLIQEDCHAEGDLANEENGQEGACTESEPTDGADSSADKPVNQNTEQAAPMTAVNIEKENDGAFNNLEKTKKAKERSEAIQKIKKALEQAKKAASEASEKVRKIQEVRDLKLKELDAAENKQQQAQTDYEIAKDAKDNAKEALDDISSKIKKEQKRIHWRKHIMSFAIVILAVAVLIPSALYVIREKSQIEEKQSSYKLTSFDFAVNTPSKEQIEEFAKNPVINQVFPCYTFEFTTTRGIKFPVLMCDSLDGYHISLFNEKTCIAGKADETGIMIDKTAATMLGVSVGDTFSVVMGGTQVDFTVSGIYMASTYQGLEKGLGLAVFTDEMKSYYTEKIKYNFAFIDAVEGQEDACKELLKGYIPLGAILTEEEFIDTVGYDIPEGEIPADLKATIEKDYAEYKANYEKGNYSTSVQIKKDLMKDVVDQVETKEDNIVSTAMLIAIATFVVYTIFGILNIALNAENDKRRRSYGVKSTGMFAWYAFSNMLCAVVIFAATGVVLFLFAANANYLSACIPLILLSTVPVFPAALIVTIFAKIYTVRIENFHTATTDASKGRSVKKSASNPDDNSPEIEAANAQNRRNTTTQQTSTPNRPPHPSNPSNSQATAHKPAPSMKPTTGTKNQRPNGNNQRKH